MKRIVISIYRNACILSAGPAFAPPYMDVDSPFPDKLPSQRGRRKPANRHRTKPTALRQLEIVRQGPATGRPPQTRTGCLGARDCRRQLQWRYPRGQRDDGISKMATQDTDGRIAPQSIPPSQPAPKPPARSHPPLPNSSHTKRITAEDRRTRKLSFDADDISQDCTWQQPLKSPVCTTGGLGHRFGHPGNSSLLSATARRPGSRSHGPRGNAVPAAPAARLSPTARHVRWWHGGRNDDRDHHQQRNHPITFPANQQWAIIALSAAWRVSADALPEKADNIG